MKVLSVIIALLFISNISNAQSFFKRMPRQSTPFGARTSGPLFGTTMWDFRPTATLVSYSLNGNEVSTGVGVAEELLSLDPTTKLYTSVFSVSALINYNLPLTPETKPANPVGASLFLGFANNHILVGIGYDGKNTTFRIGTGINFNN